MLRASTRNNPTDSPEWLPLCQAAYDGDSITTYRLLFTNEGTSDQSTPAGETAFYLACAQNHYHVATLLFSYGADINKCNDNDWTPLLAASNKGHFRIV
jgi:ankyrin repeat protein